MGQSPYKQFGKVLLPDGVDASGDIIYKYNTDVTFEPCTQSCTSCHGGGYWLDLKE